MFFQRNNTQIKMRLCCNDFWGFVALTFSILMSLTIIKSHAMQPNTLQKFQKIPTMSELVLRKSV